MAGVSLAGVCDINEERGRSIATEYKTAFYKDYREMIGRIDAASLAVPTVDHCAIGCDLLRQGIALLVEHDLSDAGAVANINKDQIAEVAPPVHPAHEHGLLARVRWAQSAAHVCTSKIA